LKDDGTRSTAAGSIDGGRQWIVVAGVNWWLNQRIKLQANYAHAQVRGGPLSDNGSYGVDGFGLRAQLDW
jgi:phosphate-selective porin